jgi:hypothetical protein
MYMIESSCLIPWNSAEKMLDPAVRRKGLEESGAGM